MKSSVVAALVSCAMWAAPAYALAAEASPSSSGAVDEAPPVRDLYEDMPYYLGGYEPDIVITRGAEHTAGLAPDDEDRRRLESFVEGLGARIEDMDSGYALVSTDDTFAFVVAIRVRGVRPGTLLPAYLPILLADLVDPSTMTAADGGKEVVIIASLGEDDEYVDLTAYDQGQTIWLLQGPEDIVTATLENLPDPA